MKQSIAHYIALRQLHQFNFLSVFALPFTLSKNGTLDLKENFTTKFPNNKDPQTSRYFLFKLGFLTPCPHIIRFQLPIGVLFY